MSLDYETSAWSEIERVNRFLDGLNSSEGARHTPEGPLNQEPRASNDDLASRYYDLLSASVLDAGRIKTCDYDEVEQGAFLGAGATMSVHRGTWRNKAIAIKKINVETSPLGRKANDRLVTARIAAATLEIRLMTNDYLRAHTNIIDLLALAWEEVPGEDDSSPSFARPVLLVELAVDEFDRPFTLDRYLEVQKSCLTVEDKTHILCDIASGLAAIHALSVVHGDLKPSNILICLDKLEGRPVAKLSDFGFSSIEPAKGTIGLGTFLWTAPECLGEADEDLRVFRDTITRDFYGFGLIIWYLLFEQAPFHHAGKRLEDRAILNLKLHDKMAEEVDEMFTKRYHVQVASASSDKTVNDGHFPSTLAAQQKPGQSMEKLAPYDDTLPHTLRAYMVFFLSLQPRQRFVMTPAGDLQEFSSRIWDQDMLQENYHRFLRGTWQEHWHPRLLVANNYAPPMDWLRRPADFSHPLRLPIHALPTHTGFHTLAAANAKCPESVKRTIFESALKRAANLTGVEQGNAVAIVAACYCYGFGVTKNTRAFNKWCRLGADVGHFDCLYVLIQAHHVGLATGDYVKINRKQLLEYSVEMLFAYAKNRNGSYFNNRLSREEFLRLKAVLCTRPTREFHGVWPVMNGFINYMLLGREVHKDKLHKAVKEFATDPVLIGAAEAIEADDPLTLDEILQENPQILRTTSNKGQTLLHLAAMMDRGGIVVKLVSRHKMDPFVRDKQGTSPIELALHLGSVKAAQAIIHYVIRDGGYILSPQKIDILGIMDKHLTEGNGSMVNTILSWTAFIKDERVFTEEDIRKLMINELMQRAVAKGNWVAFCQFCASGANPNYRRPGKEAVNVLSTAVSLNQPLMAATLLALGANPDIPGGPGTFTPLHYAAVGSGHDHDALTTNNEALYQHGKHLDQVMTFLSLYPCHSTDLQRFSIHVLLAYGANIELPEESGRSPLSGSISTSRYNCHAKFLLERKNPADIDSSDFTGSTALHFAVKAKDLQRVDFCIRYGADLEIKDLRGRTALAIAATFGHLRICQRLLGAGANIAARDANGNTCLELALHSEELTRYFLDILRLCPAEKRDLILNNRDRQGRSIIHVAVTSASEKRVPPCVLQLLIDEGIDPLSRDHIGYIPLHWVISVGDPQDQTDLSRRHFEILVKHGPSSPLLFFIPDDVLGLTIGHFLALYRRLDLLSAVRKHSPLVFSYSVSAVKGTTLALTTMELFDKLQDSESNYILKVISLIMKMSKHRAPIFNPNRVMAEYRGLERILNLRQQAVFGVAEPKQIEYDYFSSGELIEPFASRHAWLVDAHGRPRGTKLLSTFSEDHLKPRVWVFDEDGSSHGILGNTNGTLADSEKENEGWTKEEWEQIGEMMLEAFRDTGVLADKNPPQAEEQVELGASDKNNHKHEQNKEPILEAVQPPKQREDGEWIWPKNGCEVSGMEALEAEILGGLENPTDFIEYIETPLYG